ncbi:alpha/beta fold hydrolase [Kibdelosporangium philippinense]|uniref:alpha/beta fold hydrolase n=1 Tax=Kibdelosporangium philippinense TaxID=211113 RepID=UPI0036066C02
MIGTKTTVGLIDLARLTRGRLCVDARTRRDLRRDEDSRLRTDNTGPPVLLCPGLGTAPEVWPMLLLPDSAVEQGGARVLSWYHRGTMGSDRPADESRIELADHVADALAVLDAAGVRRCVVMGWSVGVMVAAELARRHPERVSGSCSSRACRATFSARCSARSGFRPCCARADVDRDARIARDLAESSTRSCTGFR